MAKMTRIFLGLAGLALVNATSYKYAYKKGFIGAGNDVIPPQNMTVGAAELKCNTLLRCKSFTYEGTNTTTKSVKVVTYRAFPPVCMV